MIYLNYLLEATQGVLRYPGRQKRFEAFSHDTRMLMPGEMFVAVRGEHGDGHDHVLDAVRRGAAGILLEEKALAAFGEETRRYVGLVGSEGADIAAQENQTNYSAAEEDGLRLVGVEEGMTEKPAVGTSPLDGLAEALAAAGLRPTEAPTAGPTGGDA